MLLSPSAGISPNVQCLLELVAPLLMSRNES